MRTFETTGQDWANYLSHEVSGNGMIYIVAILSGKPDMTILREATNDLFAKQPVLGCRFDESSEPPVWIPVNDEKRFIEMESDDLRKGIDEVIMSASNEGLRVVLLSTPEQTAICLQFDHAAIDGGGAKKCLSLLARCYQSRANGQKMTERITLERSDHQLYPRCGLADYRSALKRETPAGEPVMTVPYVGMDGKSVQYQWITLPLSAAKHKGGTVNDCVLSAYILALAKMCALPRTITTHLTIDLRRYLDEETAPLAANVSGMAGVSLTITSDASFASVLEEVRRQTMLLKSGHAGLSGAAMMTYLRTMPYKKARGALLEAGRNSRVSGTAAPILSNLGQIESATIRFGDTSVTNIITLLPAMRAPAFMLGVSGYRDSLTLSVGYFTEERHSGDINQLLLSMRDIIEN